MSEDFNRNDFLLAVVSLAAVAFVFYLVIQVIT